MTNWTSNKNVWTITDEQERTIREHYPEVGAEGVAEMLGISKYHVTQMAKQLHVVRDQKAMSRRRSIKCAKQLSKVYAERCNPNSNSIYKQQ